MPFTIELLDPAGLRSTIAPAEPDQMTACW
jgi:hypothetical protein